MRDIKMLFALVTMGRFELIFSREFWRMWHTSRLHNGLR